MEHDVQLREIALVVFAALAGGLGFARLKQPPILGYILAGILLGPSCFGLIKSRDQVSILAELGVLLLLFVVGMDLNLRTFKKVWVVSILCALMQVSGGLLITSIFSYMLGWSFGLSLLLGFVVSLSSTAVVVKMLESIGEIKSETGQIAIGVLIAQDLAIVPMILFLRNLDRAWYDPALWAKVTLSIGILAALAFYLSRKQRVRLPLTTLIVGEKDLMPLLTLTFCFAASAISGWIDLSTAYGAFLAGLFLGNTHERLLMLETTRPIQSTLLMAFFLSIGILLDVNYIWDHIWVVVLLLLAITIGKTALNIGILHLLRLPWSQSFLIGVTLAQLGEFAFLLATVGYETHIINEDGQKLIIGLTVLSLAFSPLWLSTARRLKVIIDNNNLSFRALITLIFGQEMSSVKRWMEKLHLRRRNKTQNQSPIDIEDEDA